MRVAIIGAGFAGLSAARVLTAAGHRVKVFEKAPEVGGVWSLTRRYPGVTTQNPKLNYAFSDHPMPRAYPQWPSGSQVQAYLADYAKRFGLEQSIRLDTEVVRADLNRTAVDRAGSDSAGGGQAGAVWLLHSRRTSSLAAPGGAGEEFDYLVVANGTCSEPLVPDFDGVAQFRAAGGRLMHSSEFARTEDAAGKDIVVVGYGRSACDVAVAVSDVAGTTTVVTRDLLWKMPKRLGHVLNYKYLMLTRMGEALFSYIAPNRFEAFLHGRGAKVTNGLIRGLQSLVTRQLGLDRTGLVPDGDFTRIARSTVSLASDGFYRRVRSGRIGVRRGSIVTRLLERDGHPFAELATGEVIAADLVICGTGFRQELPFLADDVQRELTDEHGNYELYRQIQPHTVPRLAFAGYNSSLFSPLGAEVAAYWIAARISDAIDLPPLEERRALVRNRLSWMEQRTGGKHSRGANITPFSMHNIDEILSDLDLDVSRAIRFKQWLLPIDPADYHPVTTELRRREQHRSRAARPAAGSAPVAPPAVRSAPPGATADH